jgi:CubicO group peptidase (beta-lactamase class C family)
MGMNVAILGKDGLLTYDNGFGYRDLIRNLPANQSTYYRIASISKSITTAVLLTLYD